MAGQTDRDWELWGVEEPYFAVLTHEKFRRDHLSEQHRADFFATGQRHVAELMHHLRRRVDAGFQPRRILDFGCGVGRLTIPLASEADWVTGVDVSPAMLREAAENCARFAVGNVDFTLSDDDLSALRGGYDLILSHIVFQHIPVHRGERLLARLLEQLVPGGIGVFHFTYFSSAAPAAAPGLRKTLTRWLRRHIPSYIRLAALLSGERPSPAPQTAPMQMNAYDLNRLLRQLQGRGVTELHSEFTDHGGELGVVLYCQMPGPSLEQRPAPEQTNRRPPAFP